MDKSKPVLYATANSLEIDTPVKMFSVPLSSARTEVTDMDKFTRGFKSVLEIHFANSPALLRTLSKHGPMKFRKSQSVHEPWELENARQFSAW